MRKEFTLSLLFISLFLMVFNARADAKLTTACNHAIDQGNAEKAVALANEILEKNQKDYSGLLCKGRALGLQDNYSQALTLHESAIKNASNNFEKVITHMLTGNLHKSNQKMIAAIASYESSLAVCKLDNNQQYARISHNLIGDTYREQKQFKNAEDSYMAGAQLANNDNERAYSYERLAEIYKKQLQYDSAIEYQVKAVVMQQKAGSLDAYANANLTLGKLFFEAKEYRDAEKIFKKLEKFSIDNGGVYYEAKANMHLAETKAATNDYTAAQALISRAHLLSTKLGAADLTSEIDAMKKKLKKLIFFVSFFF